MRNPEITANIKTYLIGRYFHSEVTSGEWIHTIHIPVTLDGTKLDPFQLRAGVQAFLDWDESTERFTVITLGNHGFKIGNVEDGDYIEYKGIRYRTRIFNVDLIGQDWEGTYKIAEDELYDAIHESVGEWEDLIDQSEEFFIDNEIYHYVENGILDLPAEEICLKHLDIPMKLIQEYES
jgi:hypothetical protein